MIIKKNWGWIEKRKLLNWKEKKRRNEKKYKRGWIEKKNTMVI
jgi:hypothetical protein